MREIERDIYRESEREREGWGWRKLTHANSLHIINFYTDLQKYSFVPLLLISIWVQLFWKRKSYNFLIVYAINVHASF